MRAVIMALVIAVTLWPGGGRGDGFIAAGGRSGRVVGYIGIAAPAPAPRAHTLYLPVIFANG